jgi:hypothetical protein
MEAKTMLSKLTPEEKAALLQELEAEQKTKENSRKMEISAYNHLKDVTVEKVFARLQKISSELENAKKELYAEFGSLLEMKSNLYGVNESQFSHTWTNEKGDVSIITGFNVIDSWDETRSAGIERVNMWLEKQATEENRKLITMVRELLKPNKEGVLKANRVLDLANHAEAIGDPELIEAVKIIKAAYRPKHSNTYIKAKYTDGLGQPHWLGLSMSSV